MAKRPKLKKTSGRKRGGGDTSFNFGFNAMTKTSQKSYRKRAGSKGGGS